jgi:hypothetical protein
VKTCDECGVLLGLDGQQSIRGLARSESDNETLFLTCWCLWREILGVIHRQNGDGIESPIMPVNEE